MKGFPQRSPSGPRPPPDATLSSARIARDLKHGDPEQLDVPSLPPGFFRSTRRHRSAANSVRPAPVGSVNFHPTWFVGSPAAHRPRRSNVGPMSEVSERYRTV